MGTYCLFSYPSKTRKEFSSQMDSRSPHDALDLPKESALLRLEQFDSDIRYGFGFIAGQISITKEGLVHPRVLLLGKLNFRSQSPHAYTSTPKSDEERSMPNLHKGEHYVDVDVNMPTMAVGDTISYDFSCQSVARADIFDFVRAQRPDLWRRHQAAQSNARNVTSTIQQMETLMEMLRDEPEEELIIDSETEDLSSVLIFPSSLQPIIFSTLLMTGYLDYWCSLDVTGSAERESLSFHLESEFEDWERMVDRLIIEQQKRREEIASELVPIEASIYSSSLCVEATSHGLILTPQLEARLREMAQEKAIVFHKARELERARARTRALQREIAAERELEKDIAK
ncbi:hypothetical protein BT96DRAFT_946436 [Gymnopus androsaceus JB14]|uniref:Uncharacterized protein n=1 Tax=Gymnopus androsaceus JB14 TaxID=1447944 RepID=A0A6A4GXG9_9AGAR|nr:hypothetical protein BT96DRAFT_946436 [Gymnopus androsaceus JB14]